MNKKRSKKQRRSLSDAALDTLIRGDHVELAARLVSELRKEGPIVFDEGSISRYDKHTGLWRPLNRALVGRVVQTFAGLRIPRARGLGKQLRLKANDVHGVITLAKQLVGEPGFFADAVPGMVFTNGFVDVASLTLQDHSPDHRARDGYPFALDLSAVAPRFASFLQEIFVDDEDAHEKRQLLQEFCGAALTGTATAWQKAMILLGPGANGKSVFIDIILAAMPIGSWCAIPPQDWGCQYRMALLAGKRLNALSELPVKDIIASARFKAVVSGDMTTGRPIRHNPFMFRPIAAHLFGGNELPGTADQTHGFWRRFIVVGFSRVFAEREQDPTLARTIIDNELPGVVAWMLRGAQRLARQGGYTIPSSCEELLRNWRREADQVALFLAECCEPTTYSQGIAGRRLYRAYVSWSRRTGHRQLAENTFGVRMRMLGYAPKKLKTCNAYALQLNDNWWT